MKSHFYIVWHTNIIFQKYSPYAHFGDVKKCLNAHFLNKWILGLYMFIFWSLCKGQSVFLKYDVTTTVKRNNTATDSYSYPRYVGVHMGRVEIHVEWLLGYIYNSNQNNTPKINKIITLLFVSHILLCYYIISYLNMKYQHCFMETLYILDCNVAVLGVAPLKHIHNRPTDQPSVVHVWGWSYHYYYVFRFHGLMDG
jgi:hypothetical protein